MFDEQLADAALVAEELRDSPIDVDVGDRRPDERGSEIGVGARVQHAREIDGFGDGPEQSMAITLMLVLFLPQPSCSLLHTSTIRKGLFA